jgi:hypothetical protein
VDGVIVVEFVAQFGFELREETVGNQRRGSCIYSWFALGVLEWLRKDVEEGTYLASREADSDNAKLVAGREELWLDH